MAFPSLSLFVWTRWITPRLGIGQAATPGLGESPGSAAKKCKRPVSRWRRNSASRTSLGDRRSKRHSGRQGRQKQKVEPGWLHFLHLAFACRLYLTATFASTCSLCSNTLHHVHDAWRKLRSSNACRAARWDARLTCTSIWGSRRYFHCRSWGGLHCDGRPVQRMCTVSPV